MPVYDEHNQREDRPSPLSNVMATLAEAAILANAVSDLRDVLLGGRPTADVATKATDASPGVLVSADLLADRLRGRIADAHGDLNEIRRALT